jgi:poly-gamma-glutamate synthesis protein (capsule biosynthesis protein)
MGIVFLGDVFLRKKIEVPEFENKYVVANLEAPITRSRCPYPNKVNLKSDEEVFDSVLGSKVSAVCLANNHIMDYGEKGFRDTIGYLEKRGINYFGAGRKSNNYENPLFCWLDGEKIAFMGYVCTSTSPVLKCGSSFGCAPLSIERVISDLEKSKKEGADQTVVQFHWGAEEVFLPKPKDVEIARTVVDAGADLIVGHHAHVTQISETYKDTDIFYGLGNYIMPDLKEKSFYKEGKYTRIYNRKQYSWNKKSLCVEYNPINKNTRTKKAYCKNDSVILKDKYRNTKGGYILGLRFYKSLYKIVYVFSKLRRVAANFLSDPKIPEKKHIKTIIRIFFGRKKS